MFLAIKCRSICKINAHKLLRTVYCGPYTTEDFTKDCKEGDTSWEAKKLRNLRQRVIDKANKVKFDGLNRLVDDEEKKVYVLPHFEFQKKSDKNIRDETLDLVMGQATVRSNDEQVVCHKTSNMDPDYERQDVKELLKRLRGKDLEKVYRKMQARYKEMPRIRLLTDEQLKEEFKLASKRAEDLLESPPIMNERAPIDDVIAVDELLDGYEHCNVVFTDITENLKHNDRFIVVREPNGKLRKSSWDERDRCQQVYFPKPERNITKPLMFQHLKNALEHKIHESVLEQVLIHYEPDSKEYIDIMAQVYDDVDKNKLFELLWSTRFFEGLTFHLTKHRTIDNLLAFFIDKHLISEATDLVTLFTIIKPQCLTASKVQPDTPDIDKIKIYLSNDAQEPRVINDALIHFEEQFARDAQAA